MDEHADQLLQAVLALPDEDQLWFLAALGASVEERGLRPFGESWLAEVRRRSTELDAGVVQPIPWDAVKECARRAVFEPRLRGFPRSGSRPAP